MQENYSKVLANELVYEGGYVNNPKDPGGATNKGVTQRVYDAYRLSTHKQKQPVQNITQVEVEAIYRHNYWNAIKGDVLPSGVDMLVMDGAVNSGPKQSIKWLQRALNVTPDGVLGTVTMTALAAVDDYDVLITKITDRREAFLRSLKTFSTFGKGWMRRLQNVEQVGYAWATGTIEPEVVHAPGGNVKASIDDAKKAPPKVVGDVSTGAGLGSSGVTVAVQTLQDQLTPFSAAGGWIAKLVIILAIISALLTVGGLAWRVYSKWKQSQIDDATDPDGVKIKRVVPE